MRLLVGFDFWALPWMLFLVLVYYVYILLFYFSGPLELWIECCLHLKIPRSAHVLGERHFSFLLMNSFNKTEAAIFLMQT